jgi:ribosomal protein S18 acetylase RimI-like enzyme
MSASLAYETRLATSDHDLQQILALQAANLPEAIGADERRAQGFVTLRHDLALLREMNDPWAHVVATLRGGEEIVAYALVMLQKFRGRLPILDPMFDRLEQLKYRGRPLTSYRYYIMGQICIAKAHRGVGLVERLYAEHRARMAPHFELMVTEIDQENSRSARAHEKAGFETLDEYRSASGKQWLIVGLDLRNRQAHKEAAPTLS